MRPAAIACAAFFLCAVAVFPKQKLAVSQPTQFEIGVYSYFDVGPPFGFYELYIVRPAGMGSSLERVALTPPGDVCIAPAKVDAVSARLKESVAALLGPGNPCAIPEKELHRKRKKCRNCPPVFSGADVVMQVQCGGQTRLIRSDVLDRDMFGPRANVPPDISWTMRLLKQLDQVAGPGPADRPMFVIPGDQKPPENDPRSPVMRELAAGKYDALFRGEPEKPSQLYRAAQKPPPLPTVRLVSITPFAPQDSALPVYPPLLRLAHVEGSVSFHFEIGPDGGAKNLIFDSGPPLLRRTVPIAVKKWRFPRSASNRQVHATIGFALNCHR